MNFFSFYPVIACSFFISFIILSTTKLRSFFKKRNFRNHIRKCGILKDEKVRTKSWFGDLCYIKIGLEEWEQDILNKEINRVEREMKEKEMEREMKKSRKEFFDTWKIK